MSELADAPCALPGELAKWPKAIDALDEADRAALGPWLLAKWVHGRLEPILAPGNIELTHVRQTLDEQEVQLRRSSTRPSPSSRGGRPMAATRCA